MKTDTLWVFRTFGFKAGFRFLYDSIKLSIKRTVKREKAFKFVDYSDVGDEYAEEQQWDEVTKPSIVPEKFVHNHDKTLN
jgi:hypothetical protein